MVDNLIKPYNADLALCIGRKGESLPQFNPLTSIAKYDWSFEEPKTGVIMLKNSLMKHQRQKLGGGKKTLDMFKRWRFIKRTYTNNFSTLHLPQSH